MKLVQTFNVFMKQRVDLNESRIDRLDGHVSAVRDFLAGGDGTIAESFLDLIAQGSYAHRTIINPVSAGDGFDADVLLELTEVDGWGADSYVEELYKRFRESGTYREKVTRRSRCVTLNYSGEFHMDVVPYLARAGEKYITNRNTNQFERTNPEGFNDWLDERNRITSGRLVKVIRLAKFLRDLKNTFSVPSVILTILLGERVSDAALWADPERYKDLPTALVNLFEDLDEYLQSNELMPNIDDPSCEGETFNHRWDQDLYANFRNWIHTYTLWIREAYDDPEREESYVKWRRVFGSDFGTHASETAISASAAHRLRSDVTDTNEDIHARWGIPVRINPQVGVRVVGRVRGNGIRRPYDLPSRGNVVERRQGVDFRVESCTVQEPYELYWKVRNTGKDAMDANQIRGQVERDQGSLTRYETTKYVGRHYVEVYVVKEGVCVARDRQPVIVKR
ncbi:cyclic GMP-AMP synthase DncV-like nucleotidyltransferase [Cryobacterium sp. BB736]|uniref:SMODS domain-containing nucleotidyltransferase n=1 Tax=Cryobacterium sp. BB736 TaxID=2746963 RepID=UPI001875D7DF|nr:hypothetical protein [Cryobacterium sp. BB736]